MAGQLGRGWRGCTKPSHQGEPWGLEPGLPAGELCGILLLEAAREHVGLREQGEHKEALRRSCFLRTTQSWGTSSAPPF